MSNTPKSNPQELNPSEKKPGKAMPTKILLGLLIGATAGLVCSLILGADHPNLEWFIVNMAQPLGNLWLRLLLMIVIPLVFSALVLGVAGLGNIKKLGRVGIKTLIYTLVLSAISVVAGLGMVNLVEPGKRINEQTAAELQAQYGKVATEKVGTATELAKKMEKEKIPLITEIVERVIP